MLQVDWEDGRADCQPCVKSDALAHTQPNLSVHNHRFLHRGGTGVRAKTHGFTPVGAMQEPIYIRHKIFKLLYSATTQQHNRVRIKYRWTSYFILFFLSFSHVRAVLIFLNLSVIQRRPPLINFLTKWNFAFLLSV